MEKLFMDKNLYAMNGVHQLVDFLCEKMVTDIKFYEYPKTTEFGVEYIDLTVRVETLHMGLGKQHKWFFVDDLHPHNCAVVQENINDRWSV